MTSSKLHILYNGADVGEIVRDPRGRLRLSYDERWRAFDGAIALSLSLPLGGGEHGHEAVDAWLQGLLPDNAAILDRWARISQVSAKSAFGLLADQRGEDCPGAFQLVRPDRLPQVRAVASSEIAWLEEAEISARLSSLRENAAASRWATDAGRFSLAGAQSKTALLYQDGRWGLPSGRMPTTHILKPPIAGLDGHAENEHLCLSLARAVGLSAARTEVRRFGDEVAIVVERFDRAFTAAMAAEAAAKAAMFAAQAAAASLGVSPARAPHLAAEASAAAAASASRARMLGELAKTQPVLRLHQEDLCQALGLRPTVKYQSEGGPTPRRIVALLRAWSSSAPEDVFGFVDALALNWLLGGTDGHSKNYALLHAARGRVRLAPLYDIASALPYPELSSAGIKLAMKVGPEYRIRGIARPQWATLAAELELDPDPLLGRISALTERLLDAIPTVWARARAEGLDHPLLVRLAEGLEARATSCLRLLRA